MHLPNLFLQGAITGLLLTMSFGAGFFALVQTSITKGLQKGLMIALGAIISDIIFIGISIYATSIVNDELPKYSNAFRWLGLFTFLALGIRTISKSSKIVSGTEQGNRPLYYYITKGFLLNIINPLVLLTWLGISLYLKSTLNYDGSEILIYFGATLVATFASQAAICIFSNKIKGYLSENFLHKMNIGIGILFIIIGIGLFIGIGQKAENIETTKKIFDGLNQ